MTDKSTQIPIPGIRDKKRNSGCDPGRREVVAIAEANRLVVGSPRHRNSVGGSAWTVCVDQDTVWWISGDRSNPSR